MTLKGVKPEIVDVPKPKFMLSGRSGVGKTMLALDFPKPYYIDTEGGAVRQQYRKKLADNGGAYFGKDQGSQDFLSVIEEIKSLATTKHAFKTLVIDSFSHLYNTAAAIAEEKIGNDFGRDKKEANRPTRQLMRWLETIDMTVILICHAKDKWERRGRDIINTGTSFDGYDKLEFSLDLWIEANKMGNTRTLLVKKSRIESFPEGLEIPLDYKEFSRLYGKETVERDAAPVVMATPEQVARLKELLEVVKIDADVVATWLKKAQADDFDDMQGTHIAACIALCEKKVSGTKGGK